MALWLDCPDEYAEQRWLDEREKWRRAELERERDLPKLTCGGVGVNFTVRDGRIVFP